MNGRVNWLLFAALACCAAIVVYVILTGRAQ
jgi:hypothetical protein